MDPEERWLDRDEGRLDCIVSGIPLNSNLRALINFEAVKLK